MIFFRKYVLVIIFIFFIIFLFNNKQKGSYVKIGEQTLKVEIADTNESRTQGLSGRSRLKENEGMLFVFETSGRYTFWMKDMIFPIDIIWLGEDMKVVYIKKDARPESYPDSFGPSINARYVLEVVSGFSDQNNLKEGDNVSIY